jgi:hypothetical protein
MDIKAYLEEQYFVHLSKLKLLAVGFKPLADLIEDKAEFMLQT